ncbi:unnamed protein product [Sphenostylis stenocarpa]|uniref:Pre-mRNA splicing factor component Cdc5p/Cef1 C-terminal domain-containing protein n=1 Tax=Sphenostylis stenocarpa TaxID=92480 RepID=A0AA86TGC7_9FABA|nr:unnamed protein product [Sphenostylis stenocarpa]
MLPSPQISDQELNEIAKLGYPSDLTGSQELAEENTTPAGKGDAIMMEAENLARLRESQTPLLGGENPELHPSDFSGVTLKKKDIQTPNPLLGGENPEFHPSDFSGVTLKNKDIQTPNPMLTPSATPGGAGLTPRIGMTPARDSFSLSMTPKGTPPRDELHINEDMNMHDSSKLELQRQADMKKSVIWFRKPSTAQK